LAKAVVTPRHDRAVVQGGHSVLNTRRNDRNPTQTGRGNCCWFPAVFGGIRTEADGVCLR
jgi:hypothetical protein